MSEENRTLHRGKKYILLRMCLRHVIFNCLINTLYWFSNLFRYKSLPKQ